MSLDTYDEGLSQFRCPKCRGWFSTSDGEQATDGRGYCAVCAREPWEDCLHELHANLEVLEGMIAVAEPGQLPAGMFSALMVFEKELLRVSDLASKKHD